MPIALNNTVRTLLCLFPVFILASCSNPSTFNLLPDTIHPLPPVLSSEPDNSESELIDIETKMCLDEELIELSKTGHWDEPPSPTSAQVTESITYDFPVTLNKQVNMYLNLFQNKQKNQFARWLAKSGIYREIMVKELEAKGLPVDLVYLAMIESGFNQMAKSRSSAIGLWQFMKPTGRQYHLKIDKYVDERRDAKKSSKAAAAYLSDLYKEFGDWHLAVAAYNGGPGKIRNGLRKYKVDNFWDLASKKYLRLETKRYVPKLIATLLIAKQPEKYGFSAIQFAPPLRYDTISVGPGMSLAAVGMISGTTSKEIKKLNRELRYSKTPANQARYKINVPYKTATVAKANLRRLHSVVSTGYQTHKIRKGDTLTRICRKYGINKTTLLKVNNLHKGKLVAGQNLRIPYSTVRYQLLPEGSQSAMAAYKDSLILHRIKRGETISKIARQYDVPQEMIVAWNGLSNSHSITAGHQLALYIQRGASPKQPSNSTSRGTTLASNITVLKADRAKQHLPRPRTGYRYYIVKNGDSLWRISQKFKISTADIKKWNKLKSNLIHPGSKLMLKKV